DDTEEFVSHIRAIKGVRVAVFIKDVQQDRVSVSLRGNGSCDLSRAAAEFGGGGHRNAAGFRLAKQEADDLLDRLIQVLQVEMARFDQA
ncbi:MAG: DHHA1 domain-containing protein, partial [Desulfobulbaceae bacterium]|nr:DHHA1 domain-containing protein [Desulfobulbaceae bacterium]